ncbi:RNase H domain-containing protein [Trichonephila clavipes]|nr:RNase H domain-containing protein [Trichonephila clavipes]
MVTPLLTPHSLILNTTITCLHPFPTLRQTAGLEGVEDGAAQLTRDSGPLIYSELHSSYINNKQSTVPSAHHWYEAKCTGGSISLQCIRQEQIIPTRFRNGPPEL